MTSYQGIVFPSRAEDLRKNAFNGYRVFLEYWDTLSENLRLRYEELAISRRTRAVLIHGQQGSGKTLLADNLEQGLIRAINGEPERNNLWHRITGGSNLKRSLIDEATRSTRLLHIEDDPAWVRTCTEWYASRGNHEHCIIVADNAERGYFVQGLLNLDDAEFLRLGDTPSALKTAAERFVALARTTLSPALFLFLTNNEDFATNFGSYVNEQHKDLMALEVLPLPSDQDKEKAVRVNINLLNPVTYWYCLDRAGPERKVAVLKSILKETFPECFAAVHAALANADRVGRPANKCVLTLAVFCDQNTLVREPVIEAAPLEKRSWYSDHLIVETFDVGWAAGLVSNERRARMLESEWHLRVVRFSNRVLNCLLSEPQREVFRGILERLHVIHGVGTQKQTLQIYWDTVQDAVASCPEDWDSAALDAFWRKGQVRSGEYERALEAIVPLYNKTEEGFLTYRPDIVVSRYQVCSVLAAQAQDAESINRAIRRDAHVFEFTAIRHLEQVGVTGYLKEKLGNYVEILEQQ